MTNTNGNNMELEEQKDLAAKVLYESGQFSFRDIGRLLGSDDKPLPYRRVRTAATEKNQERRTNTTLSEKQIEQVKTMLAESEGLSRRERREKGLRQVDIAAKLKVHQTTVSAIKRGLTPKYRSEGG